MKIYNQGSIFHFIKKQINPEYINYIYLFYRTIDYRKNFEEGTITFE